MVLPMMLPRFEFEAPQDLEAACGLLAEAGDEARLMAGGTDLLVKLKRHDLTARLVVSLARLPDMDRVEAGDGGAVRVGPLCTMRALSESEALQGALASLAEGAGAVGGPLIRNRATVGGNIVNARPCADTVPPLMSLGAELELESAAGKRSAPLDGFITGPGQSRIRPGEILTGITLPAPGGPAGSCYLKRTRRCAMEVTNVGAAAAVVLDDKGDIKRAGIVLTSVAPVLLRVPEAEATLAGVLPDEANLRAAAVKAREAVKPIDDQRSSAAYRKQMVEVLTFRALQIAVNRALGRTS